MRLLTADEPCGFGFWKKDGATSFREYWGKARSHSHPMFGSVAAYFFEYILGIKYEVSTGESPLARIEPCEMPGLVWARGSIMTPFGRISMSRRYENGTLKVDYELSDGIKYNRDEYYAD